MTWKKQFHQPVFHCSSESVDSRRLLVSQKVAGQVPPYEYIFSALMNADCDGRHPDLNRVGTQTLPCKVAFAHPLNPSSTLLNRTCPGAVRLPRAFAAETLHWSVSETPLTHPS
jgi:hypothetical protein